MTLTITDMIKIAEERGGKCLSKEYTNNYSKLTWRCKEGHQWNAVGASVRRGNWCPVCADRKRGTIEEMQKLAKKRGGLCLSKEYINCRSKLTWQCKQGHQWDAVPSSIKRGVWCGTCATDAQRATIEEMQEIARERGGKCLSKEYINNYSKLTWQCKQGHQWDAVPSTIKRGFWCSVCAREK